MKKMIFLSATFLLMIFSMNKAFAWDFCSPTHEGDTVYYNIISDTTVEVTYQHDTLASYSGHIVIPDTVEHEGTVYAVTAIGIEAFSYCSLLASVTIPNSVTIIRSSAFEFCSELTSIVIPNSVTTIEIDVFSHCNKLTSVKLGNSLKVIGNGAFFACNKLTSIIFPDNSLTRIYERAFMDCVNLVSVIIPNSVTSIGSYAFCQCFKLDSLTIGSSVSSIGASAFAYCKLGEIYMEPINPPSIGASTFKDSIPRTNPVHVPCGSAEMYRNAEHWKEFTNIIEAPPFFEVTVESNDTLMGVASLTKPPCFDSIAVVTATPNHRYRFVQWNNGVSDNPLILSLTQDTTLTAIFELIQYNVIVLMNDSAMGRVTGGGKYDMDSLATIEATTDRNHRFVRWNDSITTNPRTFTVTQDTTFTAVFEIINAISTVDESAFVTIYPNPVKDGRFTITNARFQAGDKIEIYNIQGARVSDYSFTAKTTSVNISHLSAGMYFVKIKTSQGDILKKIIKE
jgi:hypothetical protein